jgi:hypothetical protein
MAGHTSHITIDPLQEALEAYVKAGGSLHALTPVVILPSWWECIKELLQGLR